MHAYVNVNTTLIFWAHNFELPITDYNKLEKFTLKRKRIFNLSKGTSITMYRALAFIGLAIVNLTVGERCGCEDGWVGFQGSCYLFGHQQGMHYTEAEHYCEQHKARLAVVTSDAENGFLKDYMNRLKTANYWLALTDELVEGQWTWQGSEEALNFTDWAPGQPDTWHGHNEDCALFYSHHSYHWDDGPCNVNNQPLCEIEDVNFELTDSHMGIIG